MGWIDLPGFKLGSDYRGGELADGVVVMDRPGEFALTENRDGLRLLLFRPRDKAEFDAGMVKQFAFALWLKPEANVNKLAEFLNLIYQNDWTRLKKLMGENPPSALKQD